MTEEKIVKARAAAEFEVEPLFRVFKQTLVETYMKGFMRGLESAEDEDATLQRLNKEAEALEGVAVPIEEQLVRLKPDAILKRKLRQKDFNTKVWRTLVMLDCHTLGDILQISEKFYLSQPYFGKASLNILREYVKQFGYKLKEK